MELINWVGDKKAEAYLKVNVGLKPLCICWSSFADRWKQKQQLFLYHSVQAHNFAAV